jgi:hypothetical protein
MRELPENPTGSEFRFNFKSVYHLKVKSKWLGVSSNSISITVPLKLSQVL